MGISIMCMRSKLQNVCILTYLLLLELENVLSRYLIILITEQQTHSFIMSHDHT